MCTIPAGDVATHNGWPDGSCGMASCSRMHTPCNVNVREQRPFSAITTLNANIHVAVCFDNQRTSFIASNHERRASFALPTTWQFWWLSLRVRAMRHIRALSALQTVNDAVTCGRKTVICWWYIVKCYRYEPCELWIWGVWLETLRRASGSRL